MKGDTLMGLQEIVSRTFNIGGLEVAVVTP